MTTSYRPSWVQINVFEPQMWAVPGQAYSRAPRRGPFQELRAADQDADDPEVAGFTLMRQDAPEGSTLWIHDDEQGDVEAVIRFVLRLAEGLNLTGLWGFQYALRTASSPMNTPSPQGGGGSDDTWEGSTHLLQNIQNICIFCTNGGPDHA